ncbi:RluA family pseudouridine synthase [Acutalibacter caecimuris]|uniref:RluA family pseudouridine synthase n=1 Tax=Acutalibacter caecimuris TaxID=3093657 RepID=UPI002AC97E07|nr:RluA family pseudouridine synthase [Acutalibacter sp. M00118]
MGGEILLTVAGSGVRLDKLLADRLDGMSRSAVQNLIGQGLVISGGKVLAKSAKLSQGQEIRVMLPEPQAPDIVPESIPLDIVYEDSDLLVVNKPKGMVVHPAPGNYSGTLVNALMDHCGDSLSGINGVLRPGIVHRIDKDTSGLLLVAKNDFSHRGLAEQIKAHSLTREYRALVYGNIREDSGKVDAPIGRHPTERKKMAVLRGSPTAREAVTHYYVEERLHGFTYLRLRLETGRTHQIRVHMASLGHPVAGDLVYGPKKAITELHGQCLHAGRIGFVHPRSGVYQEFVAPLPAYFQKYLTKLHGKEGL